jgi:DNA polymerase (family 10)
MRQELPAGLLELLNIPGLRPDKVLKLHRELGVSSIDELEQAARDNRLASIKGLGPALQKKILQGIEIKRRGHGRRHLHRAAEFLSVAEKHLRDSDLGVGRITPAGDFRRGCELVSDLSLVAEIENLETAPSALRVNDQLTVYLTDASRYGITLLLATGADPHLADLRALAARRGFVLDGSGLHRDGDVVVAAAREEDIYRCLGLPFIPPELREGRGELERAMAGSLPELVSDADLRGILHVHTDASDGVHDLERLAEAARQRGYGYLGIADHSRSAGYAGGLSIEEIEIQHADIDRLNARYRNSLRIFKGIESDILPDGTLDYPDEVLARFDFVVASVHSRFALDRERQTARILRAVANPYTTILGHMTGRQLLRRPGYDIDIERVLAACAEHAVAVEINANPWRLDLDWRWHGRALDLGCIMSINPDAHSVAELDLTHWGVEMARKGGVPKECVLNCLSLGDIAEHFAARKLRRTVARRPARQRRPAAANARAARQKPGIPARDLRRRNAARPVAKGRRG